MKTTKIKQVWQSLVDLGTSDKELIGWFLRDKDAEEEYLQFQRTYCWYYSVAKALQPKSILEIGTRYGYSLLSMLQGAWDRTQLKCPIPVTIYDNESYEPGCLALVESTLRDFGIDHAIHRQDTQALSSLEGKHELIHVDGDHSIQGAYHDLFLVKEALEDDGVIVLDDIELVGCPGVKAAASLFCLETGWRHEELPTYRGMWLIYR